MAVHQLRRKFKSFFFVSFTFFFFICFGHASLARLWPDPKTHSGGNKWPKTSTRAPVVGRVFVRWCALLYLIIYYYCRDLFCFIFVYWMLNSLLPDGNSGCQSVCCFVSAFFFFFHTLVQLVRMNVNFDGCSFGAKMSISTISASVSRPFHLCDFF